MGLDGVMIGRKAYADPWWLTELEPLYPADHPAGTTRVRSDVVREMVCYARRECGAGTRLHHISRHLLGLYHGQPGARGWRRAITLGAAAPDANADVLLSALEQVESPLESAYGLLATGT